MTNLPRSVTVSVMTSDGAEATWKIEGSAKFVAERLAALGMQMLFVVPLLDPGQERAFEHVQGAGLN